MINVIPDHHVERLNKILTNKKLRFNTKSCDVFIVLDDIIYGQADGNYTHLWLLDGRMLCVTIQLGKVLMSLPIDSFLRANRSVIINLKYLSKVNKKEKTVIIESGDFKKEFIITKNALHLLDEIYSNIS
jgi:two-component system, LytTR family, response regulator